MTKLRRVRPGALSAKRGSVASRPWHDDAVLQELRNVSDYIASSPMLRERLGPNFDVQVVSTPTGGVMFCFEPAGPSS